MLEGLFSAIATTQVVPPASMPAYLAIFKLKQTREIYLKLDKTRKRLLNLCFCFVAFSKKPRLRSPFPPVLDYCDCDCTLLNYILCGHLGCSNHSHSHRL
jgi:hypothetical protein